MGQISSSLSSGMKGVMEENMKKQMDFQMDAFQLQMERQLAMQNEMRERQMSMGIARAREIVKYYGSFYTVLAVLGPIAAYRTKSATPVIPLIPLGFVLTYQLDAAYGTLLSRVRSEAEHIMNDERDMISLPKGMPTFEIIESVRLENKKKQQ